MTVLRINSEAYWDKRFEENWDSAEGPRQSRFFARLALENLPAWLFDQIRQQDLSVVDWGCAQGDGTDVWTSYMNPSNLSGVDFSSIAIEQARKRYPRINFFCQNWLEAQNEEPHVFDIVFSSNTLEHFDTPYQVLAALANQARKAVILALPYRELERIDEHFFSFLPNNIPTELNNDFRLIWSRVIDCSTIPSTLWGGDQIFLVYAETSWIRTLGLSLFHVEIDKNDNASIKALTKQVAERKNQINNLKQAVAERENQINNLNQAVAERENQINNLNQAVAERENQINNLNQAVAERESQIASLHLQLSQVLHSRSWAITRPGRAMMRLLRYGHFDAAGNVGMTQVTLSKWASRGNIFSAHIKKTALSIGRRTLHAMPISSTSKQRLRGLFFSSIRSLRQLMYHKKSQGDLADRSLPLLGQQSFIGSSRDVFVFAVIDWDFRFQRPQHIARNLAKGGQRVFYISNHFINATKPGYTFERLSGADNLYQVKLHVKDAPAIYFAPPCDKTLTMLELSMAHLIQDFSALSSISIVQHAYWYPLVKQLPNSYRIYDCMDHHKGFGSVSEKLMAIEKEMLSTADLITVTSSWLKDFACKYHPNVVVVRNAVEYTHFETRPEQVYADDKGRQIIGYFGAIAEWFDLDIVRAVALTHRNCLVLLVGNDTVEARKALADIPNVRFTGEIPYAKLPYYLHSFTVCLLPFKVTPLTLATNPVKVYEYLAAGKPVVCVDLPEISQFGDQVRRASSINEFVSQVGRALQESGVEAEHKAVERRGFAAGQTWDHRAKELTAAIDAVSMPRVSVIILTFNNLNLTRACLNSVLNRSDYPNLEIIVIDNASSDDTPSYLADFAAHHPNVRVVLNKENLGFAAGNNIGLSIATGNYMVMLNNDTVVTPGWVMTMLRHFQASPNLGLLNPVTNNIGNEARINISYQDILHMPDKALTYTLAHMGQRYTMRSAAFFCVMMPRSTYERCGPISEDYGRGFFEDDDYCRKVEAAGLSIACAEDVFVHHHLSASFNKLKDEERQALFERNKTIYEQKWGKWIPHVYRP